MYAKNRVSEEYINGVCAFTRAAERDMLNKGIEYMYCPCIDCENLKMFNNQAQIDHEEGVNEVGRGRSKAAGRR